MDLPLDLRFTDLKYRLTLVGRLVRSRKFDGLIPLWYHTSCFLEKFELASISGVDGLQNLRWEDQEMLRSKIRPDDKEVRSCHHSQIVAKKSFAVTILLLECVMRFYPVYTVRSP